MLKRTDIVDDKMLNDLKVIAGFDCKHWSCEGCPFDTGDIGSGCALFNAYRVFERYADGEEVIY